MKASRDDVVVLFAAAAAVITRLYVLIFSPGYLHPDSVFQLLEQAHRLVFGYGILPWEYVVGIRSWIQPLIAAAIFRLGLTFGITDMWGLIFLNRCVAAAASLVLLYVIYETALSLYGRRAAAYSLFFSVFSGVLWLWSAEPSSHVPSVVFACAAMMFFWRGWKEQSGRAYLFSGLSLGVAFMLRFDSLLLLPALLTFAFVTKKARRIEVFCLGLAVVIVMSGLVDLMTWGDFMHSPLAFIKYDFFEPITSSLGTAPPYYYLAVLGLHLPCLFLLAWTFERKSETAYLYLNLLIPLLFLSALAHKELRYVILALPPFLILAGRGMERLEAQGGARTFLVVAIFTIFLGAAVESGMSGPDMYTGSLAAAYVGAQTDSTAVAYDAYWWQMGGYVHLHKPIPSIYLGERTVDPQMANVTCGRPDMGLIGYQCSPLSLVLDEPRINYIITENETLAADLETKGFSRVQDFDYMAVLRRA